MTVFEWLETPAGTYKDGMPRTVLNYLAELISVNNGTINLTNFGKSVSDINHPYGRVGLTVIEAIQLMELRGTMNGLFLGMPNQGNDGTQDKVIALIKEEISKKKPLLILPGPDDTKKFRTCITKHFDKKNNFGL